MKTAKLGKFLNAALRGARPVRMGALPLRGLAGNLVPPGMSGMLRGLSDQLGGLAPVPGLRPGVRPGAEDQTLPEGASFQQLSFSNAAGTRPYKLYVPSCYAGQAVPLVVMLHGCTQSPDDIAAGTRLNALAEENCLLVAYPQQTATANQSRCWNWFDAENQGRDRGEASLIAGITRDVMHRHSVDPARVYIAGFSAGGAAAAIMAAEYPDLYAAAGIHSGLPCGAASDLQSALRAMRQGSAAPASGTSGRQVPKIIFHGDRDTTVSPRNADAIVAQARMKDGVAAYTEHGQAAGGRNFTRTTYGGDGQELRLEQWVVHGAGHAWAGGGAAGTYTDPAGPDAMREMVRFFLAHRVGG